MSHIRAFAFSPTAISLKTTSLLLPVSRIVPSNTLFICAIVIYKKKPRKDPQLASLSVNNSQAS